MPGREFALFAAIDGHLANQFRFLDAGGSDENVSERYWLHVNVCKSYCEIYNIPTYFEAVSLLLVVESFLSLSSICSYFTSVPEIEKHKDVH